MAPEPGRLRVRRVPAGAAEVEAAFAALGRGPGAYFGIDAGVPGLHPLQACLVHRPALALAVRSDGLRVRACSRWGAALLAGPLAAWAAVQAGTGRPALEGARALLAHLRALCAAEADAADLLLLGALRFEAYRLAPACGPAPAPPMDLGTLFLPEACLRRDGAGSWWQVALDLPGLALSAVEPDPAHAPHQAGPQDAAPPADDFAPGGYAAQVAQAVALLRTQPLLSLTLSQRFCRPVAVDAAAGFARLRAANPAPASFFFNLGQGEQVFGASPDLQLQVHDRVVRSFPVCGTVPRPPGPLAQAQALRELLNEEVDAASLAVCSDALRADLAPLCKPGSLRLAGRRLPMALATVVHTVDHLEGTLAPGRDAWDAIAATAAPVMLTGTPRALALAAIARLEVSPRGWYGGLMVQVAGNGDALVGTLLRAASVRDGLAQVRTGGDLVADSDPAREEAESRHKALSLWRALGLDDSGQAPAAQAPQAEPAAVDALAAALGALRLHAEGDALAPGLLDLLRGWGWVGAAGEGPALLLHSGPVPPAAGLGRAVLLGDAALRALAQAGWPVAACTPAHGRIERHALAEPMHGQAGFLAARYATLAIAPGPPVAGWQVWAHDAAGAPSALLHPGRRLACLTFRPDSLGSDDAARALLRRALLAVAAG